MELEPIKLVNESGDIDVSVRIKFIGKTDNNLIQMGDVFEKRLASYGAPSDKRNNLVVSGMIKLDPNKMEYIRTVKSKYTELLTSLYFSKEYKYYLLVPDLQGADCDSIRGTELPIKAIAFNRNGMIGSNEDFTNGAINVDNHNAITLTSGIGRLSSILSGVNVGLGDYVVGDFTHTNTGQQRSEMTLYLSISGLSTTDNAVWYIPTVYGNGFNTLGITNGRRSTGIGTVCVIIPH
jgi:hypothetical protein